MGVKKEKIYSEPTTYIITNILSDRTARAPTFSLESPLAAPFWTAVKTGTSKDMRDNWCLGVSEKYTVGVWVGNFSGASMWNVSGMSGAAPLPAREKPSGKDRTLRSTAGNHPPSAFKFAGDHTARDHPFPSRTRKLSLAGPMVLHGRLCGRLGDRRH